MIGESPKGEPIACRSSGRAYEASFASPRRETIRSPYQSEPSDKEIQPRHRRTSSGRPSRWRANPGAPIAPRHESANPRRPPWGHLCRAVTKLATGAPAWC